MTGTTITFCVSESTSFRSLAPVAERLKPDVTVEWFYLDDVLTRSKRNDELPDLPFGKIRYGGNYINNERLADINRIDRSQPLIEIAIQRIVEDNISPDIVYDLNGYMDDVQPDLFVSGHDLKPFIKHLIKRCHERNVPTAVIQHGINRPLLENPDKVPGVPQLLTPTESPRFPKVEYLKRRFGFNYGPFVFCNPYVDELYTLGSYFTERLSDLRNGYPNLGKTNLVTTGSAEFNPSSDDSYDANANSVLFLSQWQYELGEWDENRQRKIVEILERIEAHGHSVTIRPHPKDSADKVRRFFDGFKVSNDDRLAEDIAKHDLALTVDSTALCEAVLQGKPVGIVHPPWKPVNFPPFTHHHLLNVRTGEEDLAAMAADRSHESQRAYLQNFCYVPGLDANVSQDSPVELITDRLHALADS